MLRVQSERGQGSRLAQPFHLHGIGYSGTWGTGYWTGYGVTWGTGYWIQWNMGNRILDWVQRDMGDKILDTDMGSRILDTEEYEEKDSGYTDT